MRYLVTYVRCNEPPKVYTDHYEPFIDLDGAMRRWKHLTQQHNVWSANVSKIIESTDYEKSVHGRKCPADVYEQIESITRLSNAQKINE
jgi:hypothetical protein